MAKITEEKIDELDEKLIVELAPEDYEDDYQKSINSYSKRAELKGFKKGKVPKPLVKKMYGRDILMDLLMRKAYDEVNTYVRDKDLKIFAQPIMVDAPEYKKEAIDESKSYNFSFEIGMRPEFEIAILDGKHEFEKLEVEATDEMVEDDIDRLQNRMGEMTEPESISDENTVLNVTMREVDADGEAVEGSEDIEDSFLLSYLDEGSRPEFMNKKVGDRIVIQFSDAFSSKLSKAMAKDLGIDAKNPDDTAKTYSITIDKIAFVEKAELNEGFYDQVFPNQEIKTEEDFKTKIKSDIQNQWEDASINLLDNSIYEALVHETQMDLPSDFLHKWLKYREEKPLTDEELAAAFPSFEHQLRWTVISDKIIAENDIKVEEEEVRESIENEIKRYFGMNPNMEEGFIDSFVDQSVQNPEQYQKTANEIMAKKVMAVCREQVKIKNVKVSPEEFREKSEALSHKYHNH